MDENTGWIIKMEENNMSIFWAGAPYSGRNKGIDAWTAVPEVAVRFARERDAMFCATMQHIPLSAISVVEYKEKA